MQHQCGVVQAQLGGVQEQQVALLVALQGLMS
jgi:hypothetical protein